MTAEEFLRELALRVEVVTVVPTDLDVDEDPADHMEPELVIRVDPYDAEQILSLTGVRVA